MRVQYQVQTEKVNKTIEWFRKDLELFKTNLIANGSQVPSYSAVDGNRLAEHLTKLQTDFSLFCRDTGDR